MNHDRPWLVDSAVRRSIDAVEQLITEAACRGGKCPDYHAQLLSPRSKRLRPALLLLAARFGPMSPQRLLISTAAGIEALHEATLYHDDIIDESATRRGGPSVQALCGRPVAGLAGAELLYATAEFFADLPPQLRRSVGRAGEALCRGILRETELLGRVDVTVRQRLRVMRDKTGTDFMLAARLGARLSGAPAAVTRHLVKFGLWLGLCFQLADDVRDLVGTPQSLGRPPGADLVGGVYSLPIQFALESPHPVARELRTCLVKLQGTTCDGPDRAELIQHATTLVKDACGLQRALDMLTAWTRAARAEVQALAPAEATPARRSLDLLARQLHAEAATAIAEADVLDGRSTPARSA